MSGREHELELATWADRIERTIAEHRVTIVDRAAVLAKTGSTQDAAAERAFTRPGVVATAGRQTGGRGRLGRSWADTAHLGVAATFAIDGTKFESAALSLGAGLAAWRVCSGSLGAKLGLRWPNDVVERGGAGRKLSGVLIERRGNVALIGIGINVGHAESDFPPALHGKAASLAMLGDRRSRIDVLCELVLELDLMLKRSATELADLWRPLDTLTGTRRVFEHDGRRVEGVVECVDPTGCIEVRTESGPVSLPALSTSMVHE